MSRNDFIYRNSMYGGECYPQNHCHPHLPCSPQPFICCYPGPQGEQGPQGATGPAGLQGATGPQGVTGTDGQDGKSAYQVALDAGFIGTESEWLESLRGATGPQGEPGVTGPFLSSYMEALANAQTIDAAGNVVFDPDSVDSVGGNITLSDDGTIFTINRTGLYHIEWNLNLSDQSGTPVVGIIEDGVPASGATSSIHGSFSSGTLINVERVPFTISLQNFDSEISIENPVQWTNSAGSIRIVRFADGSST